MRPRVAGMNEIDDAILEFFEEQAEGVVLSPSLVWWNLAEERTVIDKSRETVARRMRNLPARGLLKKVDTDRAYYRLTEKGRAYLAGDLDADDLRVDSGD